MTAGLGRAALQVAAVYAGARIVTTAMLWIAAALSGPASRFGADATVGDLMMGWDGQWYWYIAVAGYPSELPRDEAGDVQQNAWAFMPLYPFVSALVGAPFGSYPVGAIAVSLIAGYLACLVLNRMLAERIGAGAALWATAFFAAGPMAALFQIGYGEALFLLWLLLGLWAVQRRRLWWLLVLVTLMGYTRPGVLAFSLFLALYGIWRFARRRRDPLAAGEVVAIVASGLLAAVVGFSWQVVAAVVTGEASAYLDTELSWRRDWIGEGAFVPFDGFVQGAALWGGLWGWGETAGVVALVVVVLAVAAALAFLPAVRRLGVETRLWAVSYLLYLLAVFFPQSSLFRLLVPLSPLWGAFAVPRSRIWRVGVLVAGLALQWWWIHAMFALGNAYTRIP